MVNHINAASLEQAIIEKLGIQAMSITLPVKYYPSR